LSQLQEGILEPQNNHNIIKLLKFKKTNQFTLYPSTNYWFSSQGIPLNDPLVVKVGENKDTIEFMNYTLWDLKDVVVYFEYPAFSEERFEVFRTNISSFERVIFETGIYDTNNRIKLTVEVEDPRYKKLRAMNICWRITIPMNATYGATKRQTFEDVKNIIMVATNMAYTMQSEEMKKVLINFEKIVGRKFRIYPEYKDDTGAGVSNYKDNPTNTPEEIMCIDLTKEEDLNRLLTVYGVGSQFYGGPQNRNTFSLGVVPNSKALGAGVTQTWFPANYYRGLGHGVSIVCREQYIKPQQGNVLHNTFIHEMGHCLGFWHYNSMCYGEMIDHNPRVIETICNLFGSELPYWDEMPKLNKVRVGGNDLERYIINNPDFIPKFYNTLMSERDARNAELDRFNKSKSVTGLWFVDTPANEALLNSIHPVDKFTYDGCMNMNIFKAL
jgi:hypothetical protein